VWLFGNQHRRPFSYTLDGPFLRIPNFQHDLAPLPAGLFLRRRARDDAAEPAGMLLVCNLYIETFQCCFLILTKL
jgi:hypothetical protein